MKKLLAVCLGLVVVTGILGYSFRTSLTRSFLAWWLLESVQTSEWDALPDGLHVALCGAGSPLPDPKRVGPCVAVLAGERLFIVDAGAGGVRNFRGMGLRPDNIEAILLTHFHSDHIDGLGEMLLQRWATGGSVRPTPVFGPTGVEQVVRGINQVYALDAVYRAAHHGEETMPLSGRGAKAQGFEIPAQGDGITVIDEQGLTITAFRVDHAPVTAAVGYRFDYKGRSLLISGDTAKSSNLTAFAQGVDLLVHEALDSSLVLLLNRVYREAGRRNLSRITADIPEYHTSPIEAAEIARDAGVQALLFYHIIPPLLLPTMHEIFLEGVEEIFNGVVVVGQDGTLMSLPTGSVEVNQVELF